MFDHPELIPEELTFEQSATPSEVSHSGSNHSPSEEIPAVGPNHHAEAGRKGAQRVHQLIQQGRLYEQEHGLKRGRQRIRQLIEEGKLYEQEHGLRSGPQRVARQSSDEVVRVFLHSLVRLVQPRFRVQLLELVQRIDRETGEDLPAEN